VDLQLQRGPCWRIGQDAAQYRDELPLPGRRGGSALERRLLDPDVHLWAAVSGRPGQRQNRGTGGRRLVLCRHLCHKTIALAIDRLQEPLGPPAVPNGLAHGFDRTLQRRLADELLGPELLAQLLFGDDPVTLRQQVSQSLEYFAPQPVDAPGAGELSALRIEGTRVEDVQHGGPPPPSAQELIPHGTRAATPTTGGCARARACLTSRSVDVWIGHQYSTVGDARKIPGLCQEISSLLSGLLFPVAL
jgi:hypothetical protein